MYENPEALFGGDKRLFDLISLIYAGVEEPALWNQVLDAMAELLRSEAMCMLTNYHHATCDDFLAYARTDLSVLKRFALYSPMNIWATPADRAFPDGTVRYGSRLVPDPVLERSEWYNDFLRNENGYYGAGIRVPLRELAPVNIATMRRKDCGPYEDSEGTVFLALLPHFQRALTLHFQFRLRRSGLDAVLNHLPYGLVLLDSRGRCFAVNRAAKEILDKNDGLILDKGHLHAKSPGESARLRALIGQAVQRGNARLIAGTGATLISRRQPEPLRVVVAPHISAMGNIAQAVAAHVEIHDPCSPPASRAETLRSLYGLTKAEAKLADLLAQGCNLTEAADRNSVTRETVRSQLKSIFQKTGARRQAELVRLLATIPTSAPEAD